MSEIPEKTSKDRILDAAFKIIDEKTITGTRMRLIANEAGMSTATLVYHFKSKNDLLKALLIRTSETFNQKVFQAVENRSRGFNEKLHKFFEMERELIEKDKASDRMYFDFWVQGQIDPEINVFMQDLYNSWRNDYINLFHEFYPDIEPSMLETLSRLMLSMLLGASLQYTLCNHTDGLDEYISLCEKTIQFLLNSDDI